MGSWPWKGPMLGYTVIEARKGKPGHRVRVRPLTAQEIVLYKEPYVDDGMRTMRRASVGGTGWGAKPAKKRAAVAHNHGRLTEQVLRPRRTRETSV